jgi:hypothetical protein
MNTKDIIQEAAEAYDGSGMSTDTFSGIVDFFLTHAKEKHGAELVKVEVDDEEVIDMLCWKIVKKEETIESIFDQALAIGREQGRKEVQDWYGAYKANEPLKQERDTLQQRVKELEESLEVRDKQIELMESQLEDYRGEDE